MPTSSDIAVAAEGLGKRYRIGLRKARYETLRDTLMQAMVTPARRLGRLLKGEGSVAELDATFWALKEVSFEIQRGEVVGIIGRNGAGKSTLLKVLSRITEPTEGWARLHGRVGSLLEVGTGFHPELTGRENIYLNGAILGMGRQEIDRKLEEIVAFAEIERFADTPVKHYSSGMYVRLAFAVAAHLEPEIMLVDEVLAVGDAAFQKKCLARMDSVAREGRTVIFVSHDMASISNLCSRTMLIEEGRIAQMGQTAGVVSAYLEGLSSGSTVDRIWSIDEAPCTRQARLVSVCVRPTGKTEPQESIPISRGVDIRVRFEVIAKMASQLNIVILVKNHLNQVLFSSANYSSDEFGHKVYEPGTYESVCTIPADLFNDGRCGVDVLLVRDMNHVVLEVEEVVNFATVDDGSSRSGYLGPWVGLVRPRCSWKGSRLRD